MRDDTHIYLVMEYCDGNMLQYLRKNGRIRERLLQHILKQLANGLKDLASKRIVHRDLKPDNILFVNPKEENELLGIKICDFGLARIIFNTPAISDVGTLEYMAPEMIKG